ncbi:Rho-binding antiterminator [Neptuniibacter halophilus]|uniref:Rho-binding antiterminator n=1 Tax=Neptuniibacter halophilus TaxID=651666 RepID=UPI002573A060|nr:Rho-binding antiterminator [Neptuniibacter halophilus]
MADESHYQPINCEIHDGFELACMRHAVHLVIWQDGEQQYQQKLRFLDLEYRADGEYLIAEDSEGTAYRIRLDQISSQLPY